MIRMIQSVSAGQAKAYFNEALSKNDYYLDEQELPGQFHGKIAEQLSISGTVERDMFHRLCDNKHPIHEVSLTPRTNSDRTVGYDISFNAPKSASIAFGLNNDPKIMDAFQKSVRETMMDIEKDAKTRVRIKGQYDDREAEGLVWAEFVHQTARPVENHVPDPQLHCHNYVFNAVYDPVERRYKAGQFRDIKRDMPYYQALFHKRFAGYLHQYGYQTHKTENSFELDIVPKEAITLFSKRTNEIEKMAEDQGIVSALQKDGLGARSRAKKQKGLSMAELRANWKGQIEKAGIKENGGSKTNKTKDKIIKPEQTIDYALSHCFERASVMQDRKIMAEAIKSVVDNPDINIESIKTAFQEDKRIIHVPDGLNDTLCTTKEVLSEEKRMVQMAVDGKGKCAPFIKDAEDIAPIQKDFELNLDQHNALKHILSSTDRITLIEGGAGTGKTTLIKSADELIKEHSNKEIFYFAPTAGASRGVLREEGFEKAETVYKLLNDPQMKEQIKDQVVWLDEAGMMGTGDMARILDLAEKQNARVILSGDTRQHGSVSRGDSMRILKTVAGLPSSRLQTVMRQKTRDYKDAVESISQGNMARGFDVLDKSGFIKEMQNDKAAETLAGEYIEGVKRGKQVLVVSPTNEQAEKVTTAIRENLKENGSIGIVNQPVTRLRNRYLTEAEKTKIDSYREGHVIQFHQHIKGVKKAEKCPVIKIDKSGVIIKNKKGDTMKLPLEKGKYFDVYHKDSIPLSTGDLIRITKNGFDEQERRLDNGKMLRITGFSKDGDIIASSDLRGTKKKDRAFILDKEFANLNHGYALTSHASQGKTVDRVLIYQPAATFPATNEKQLYVSVSRGRESVTLYTDQKQELLHHARKMGNRQSAMELVGQKQGSRKQDLYKSWMAEKQQEQIKQQQYKSSKERDNFNDYDRKP